MIILIIDEPQPIKYLEETIDLVCEMKELIVVGCIENSLPANNFNQNQYLIELSEQLQEIVSCNTLEIKMLDRDLSGYYDTDYLLEDFGIDTYRITNSEITTANVVIKHENPNCPIRGTPY